MPRRFAQLAVICVWALLCDDEGRVISSDYIDACLEQWRAYLLVPQTNTWTVLPALALLTLDHQPRGQFVICQITRCKVSMDCRNTFD